MPLTAKEQFFEMLSKIHFDHAHQGRDGIFAGHYESKRAAIRAVQRDFPNRFCDNKSVEIPCLLDSHSHYRGHPDNLPEFKIGKLRFRHFRGETNSEMVTATYRIRKKK